MFGKTNGITPLQAHKQLLLAESELNREQIQEELSAIRESVGQTVSRLKTVGSLASVATLLVAGVSAFRHKSGEPPETKTSWVGTILKGAQVAGSLWLGFRSRK
jgi:hypothetical protein